LANKYRIQVLTSSFVPELGTEYKDAQYLDVPSDMSIDKIKEVYEDQILEEEKRRIALRIDEINNPPVYKEPSKEELLSLKADILAQTEYRVMELDAQIATAKLAKDLVADDGLVDGQ
jgi:hypothetical protein